MKAELLKALQRKMTQYAITNAEIRMSANHRIKGDKCRTGMVLATEHEAQVAVLREAVQELARQRNMLYKAAVRRGHSRYWHQAPGCELCKAMRDIKETTDV